LRISDFGLRILKKAGSWQIAAGRRNEELSTEKQAGGRRQRAAGRGNKKKILLWERLSRPPRLSESDGGQAAAIWIAISTISTNQRFD